MEKTTPDYDEIERGREESAERYPGAEGLN